MKSKLTLLVMLMSITSALFAQHAAKESNNTWHKNQAIFKKLQALNQSTTATKTRATDDRLIAEVYETTTTDSTTYSYSGTRGSVLDPVFAMVFNEHYFDKSTYYSLVSPLTTDTRTTRTYNTAGYLITEVDSSYTGSSWIPSSKSRNTYTGGNITSTLQESWNGTTWENSVKTDNVYTGNNLLSQTAMIWNATNWENSFRITNTYTGSNITEQLFENWTGTAWEGLFKSISTYNASNKLLTEIGQVYNAPNWDNDGRQSYTYNGTTGLLEKVASDTWSTQWDPSEQYLVTASANRINSFIGQQWNGTSWDNLNQVLLTYNAGGYPLTDQSKSWNGTAFVHDPNNGDYKQRYYYESYNNSSVGVNDLEIAFGAVKLYPNPANDFITIELEKNPNTIKDIKVIDMKGQVVANSKMNNSQTSAQVSLANLASGNYFIKITDATGASYSVKISKAK